MGKKQDNKKGSSTPSRSMNRAVSLREESSGKTHVDTSSFLRIQHMQRLATWVSSEGGVGPLGALLGARLAANAEASGIPLDPSSTLLCQRCETVLQPGFNCTIRIKKKKSKKKAMRRKKSSSFCQNSVAYACHFCGHQNLRWGGAKGVVKSLLSSRKLSSVDSKCRISRADIKSKTRVAMKDELGHHSQVVALQAESLSEKDEVEKRTMSCVKAESVSLKPTPPIKTKMEEEGVVTSMVEPISGGLTGATPEEDNMAKEAVATTNAESVYKVNHISPEKVKRCEVGAGTLKAELSTGSKIVTPERNKLKEETDPKKRVTPFRELASMSNKKGKKSASVTSKAPTSANKSAANDSGKETNSSRKRARKGWTTLKQIAESDVLERKKRIGNFVIPFFM